MATTGTEFQRWFNEHVLPTQSGVVAGLKGLYGEDAIHETVLAAVLDKAISPLVYWVRDNPGPSSTPPPNAKTVGGASPGPSTSPPRRDMAEVVVPEIVVAGVVMDHFVSGDVEVIQPRKYLENWKEVASVLGLKWKWDREERAFIRPIEG